MSFKIVRVRGNSMHPSLESGAFVLLWRCRCLQHIFAIDQTRYRYLPRVISDKLALKVGDIVAVAHPKFGQIIKRVVGLQYITAPSAQASNTDSRVSGPHLTPRKDSKVIGLRLRLAGDNQANSISESDMGWIDATYVIGRVIYSVHAP